MLKASMHIVIDASVLAKPAPSSWGKEWEQFLASRPPRNEAEKWVWLKMIGPPKMDWSIIRGTNMWSHDLWPKLTVRFLLMTILWSSWPYLRHIIESEILNPKGSMYGIFTYIWLTFMVNVGKYTSPWIVWEYHCWFNGRKTSNTKTISGTSTWIILGIPQKTNDMSPEK